LPPPGKRGFCTACWQCQPPKGAGSAATADCAARVGVAAGQPGLRRARLAIPCAAEADKARLGGVDEFDQAYPGREADDVPEVSGGLFAAEGDALEALEAPMHCLMRARVL